MLITVTQEHIKKAHREGDSCPIAKALTECGFQHVYVSPDLVDFVLQTGKLVVLPLPEEAQQFIADYDHYLPVTSFSFELDADAYKDLL